MELLVCLKRLSDTALLFQLPNLRAFIPTAQQDCY